MKYMLFAATMLLVAAFSLSGISPNLLAGQRCPIDRVTRPGVNAGIAGPDCPLPGGAGSPRRLLRSL